MIADERFYRAPAKYLAVFDCLLGQRFEKQRLQYAAKPIMHRDVESDFGPVQDRVRQLVTHELSQDVL